MFSSVLKHKCSLTEQTLTLLFSHEPLPHQPFSENPKKTLACIWERTQYRTLCSTFELQSSALTNQPSLDDDNYNVSVRIRNTESGLRKISFSFPGGIPLYFEMGMGKGCCFESTRTPLPHFSCFLYLSSLLFTYVF